jgi:hypothetical protein
MNDLTPVGSKDQLGHDLVLARRQIALEAVENSILGLL